MQSLTTIQYTVVVAKKYDIELIFMNAIREIYLLSNNAIKTSDIKKHKHNRQPVGNIYFVQTYTYIYI